MNHEKKITKAFKDFLSDEFSSAQVKRAKKDLLQQFSARPQFEWKPVMIVPVLSLMFMVILIYHMYPLVKPEIKVPPVVPVITEQTSPIKVKKVKVSSMTKQIEKIIHTGVPSDVKVTRVSSDIGPAMVYQKNYRDAPITIVWVFPKEVKQ